MIKLLIIISLLFFTTLTIAQTIPFDMVISDGSTSADYAYDIWVDDSGNKYITGKFKGEINFGNGVSITPIDNFDAFIAKYDKDNNIQWANSFGGFSADEGRTIAVDDAGNVIVTISFFSTINLGADTLFSYGNFDVAVIKFNSNGDYIWMKQLHTTNQDRTNDMKIDSQGNYILVGYYGDDAIDTLRYEGLEIESHGEREVFVIKMDPDGNPIWGVTAGGADNDYVGGVVIDKDDNIYFNGYYDNVTATFGAIELPHTDGYEIFLAKLNSTGIYEWAVAATGSGDDKGFAIEYIDRGDTESGLILVTGSFKDSIFVGASNEFFESNGSNDIFVLAYTTDGDYEFGFSYGGDGDDQGKGINYIKGSDGDYFVSAITKSDLVAPNDTLFNFGKRDVLVMQMKQDNLVWAKNYGGSLDDIVDASTISQTGKIYLAGSYKSSPAIFDRYNINTKGNYDLWIGEIYYSTPPPTPIILSIEDIPEDQGGKVRIEFSGSELTKSFSIWRQIDSTSEWDAIGSFDGVYDRFYSYVALTLGDSTIDSIAWSTFKVSAHFGEVQDFFISEPASGYSIDNLAPIVPSGIIADGYGDRVELTWDDNEDKDFQYYAIYRSSDSEFNPDTMNTYTFSTIENSFTDVGVELEKTYFYKIVAIDFSGNQSEYSEKVYALVTDIELDIEIPTIYDLAQNYPNPFNPSTLIEFSLPESGLVTLKIYNILGEEVATLINEMKAAGVFEVQFDASQLTTGIYIYRIKSGDFIATKKMLLVK